MDIGEFLLRNMKYASFFRNHPSNSFTILHVLVPWPVRTFQAWSYISALNQNQGISNPSFHFFGPPRTLSPSLFLKKTSFTLLGCQELVNPNFRKIVHLLVVFYPEVIPKLIQGCLIELLGMMDQYNSSLSPPSLVFF